MLKRLLLLLTFVLLSPAIRWVSALESQVPPFTVQTITLNGLPAYDLKVSPDGAVAAAYIGPMAAAVLNIPVMEYVPEEPALPIHLLDLTAGTELGLLTGPTDYVYDVAFTPDGKQLVSYHRNGELFLWDVTTQTLIKRFTSFLGANARLEFLPDGKTLLVDLEIGFSGNFLLWNLETDSITKIWHKDYRSFGEIKATTPDNLSPGYAAFDLSPDGTLLVSVSRTGEVVLWDTVTLEPTVLQKEPEDSDQKLKAILSITAIAFSSDAKQLAYYDSTTRQTHVWDVATHTESKTLSIGSSSWAISPSGDDLAWVAERKELWLASLDQPDAAVKVLDFPDELQASRPTLTFTPDGTQLVVGGFFTTDTSGDNTVYIIKLE